jgi:signal transduction histidine kinase
MRRRLIAGFLGFSVVALIAIEVPFGLSLAANARSTAITSIQNDGASLGLLVGSALSLGHQAEANSLIDRFSVANKAVVVLVSDGKARIAAGAHAAEELADPETAPILAAASSGRISGEESGREPDDDLLYVALPIAVNASSSGVHQRGFSSVLLLAESAAPLHARVRGDWLKLLGFGLGLLVVASIVGTLLARSLTRSLAEIELAVSAFGAGRLSERAPTGRGPSELRNLAETVNEMARRLEELLDAQRAFVGDASHQLRTPLTALRLRLENLEQALGQGDRTRTDLARVIAEADRLSRVVDGLLALARSEGVRPERRPVDVDKVLEERREAWSALAEERGISLAIRTTASDGTRGPCALACEGSLEQVLDNLLSNALDVTPPGGTVTLRAGRTVDSVEIHVVDSGPGMTSEEREQAFERFWRKDGVTHDGTGLGLAIAAQLLRASGGTAWLDPAEEGGVDAVVQLEPC